MKTNREIILKIIRDNWLPNDIGVVKFLLGVETETMERGGEIFNIAEVSPIKEFETVYGPGGEREWLIKDYEPKKTSLAELIDDETTDLIDYTRMIRQEIIKLVTEASGKETFKEILEKMTPWYEKVEAEVNKLYTAEKEKVSENNEGGSNARR